MRLIVRLFNPAHLFPVAGYLVLGIDYFLGDSISAHLDDPNFDRAAWFEKSTAQADDVLPKWLKAVRETYGTEALYSVVGEPFVRVVRTMISKRSGRLLLRCSIRNSACCHGRCRRRCLIIFMYHAAEDAHALW